MSATGAYFIKPQSGFNGIPPYSASPDGITLDLGGLGGTLEIKPGGVSNSQVSATAAITLTKLASTPLSILGQVSNALSANTLTTAAYASLGISITPITGKMAIIIGKLSINMESTGNISLNGKLVTTLTTVYSQPIIMINANSAAVTVNADVVDIPILGIFLNPNGVATVDLQVFSSVAGQYTVLGQSGFGSGFSPTYISAITLG